MSSGGKSSSTFQNTVDGVRESNVYAYSCVGAAVFILYEYALTLSTEIDSVWNGRKSLVTALFFFNRYALLVVGVLYLFDVPIYWSTPLSCETMYMLQDTISIAIIAVSSGFSALRVYAISGHRLAPALITLTLGMVFVGVRMYYYVVTSYAYVQHAFGHSYCDWNIHVSNPLQSKLTIAERVCGIAADLIVLIVTWYRTYHIAKDARRAALRTPIVVLLLRDGTLYFIALLMLDVLGILLTGGIYGNESDWSVISIFLAPFSSILVSRFILNLRKASSDDAAGLDSDTDGEATSTQSAVFASRLVGNIGMDLQYDTSSSDVVNNEENADVGDEHDENVTLEVGSIMND